MYCTCISKLCMHCESALRHRQSAVCIRCAGQPHILNELLLATAPCHGRCAGVSKSTDERGFHTYQRPEGKSGGHGVGWSEVPRYEFKIPDGWEEVPVNVFDLGGTEVSSHHTMVLAARLVTSSALRLPCRP